MRILKNQFVRISVEILKGPGIIDPHEDLTSVLNNFLIDTFNSFG